LNIGEIIRQSKNIDYNILCELIDREISYHINEINNYYDLRDGILRFDPSNYREIYVFGDIHGDFLTLSKMLEKINFNRVISHSLMIFLGDYIDRGDMQIQVLNLLLHIHLLFPMNIIILRGNHERPEWLPVYPHDFPTILSYNFGRKGGELYNKLLKLFDLMPHIAYYDKGLIFLHGGLPINEDKLINMTRDKREILAQILWNDPFDGFGYEMSYRGIGYLFGIDITEKFLKKNRLRGLVRGHEPVNGYRVSQRGYTLTLFTRLGPPYYNKYAAVYRYTIEEFEDFKNGEFITL